MTSDLVQNAVEADSSEIVVEIYETVTELTVTIRDNGKGMSAELLERVKDPFYTDGIKHPGRKIGLGIPFLIQTVTETGGSWDISSREHQGTTVRAQFNLQNIDTPPIGDVPGMFRQILTLPGNYEMLIFRKKTGSTPDAVLLLDYRVARSELADILGDLETAGSMALLGQYLQSQEEND
jgi:hypothetical protein